LQKSYLWFSYLWFLLLGVSFHILGFGFVTTPTFYFLIWVSSFKSHFSQNGNEKISSIVNMHDFAFNFNFPSLVFVGCVATIT
jgi:hypothetical protein